MVFDYIHILGEHVATLEDLYGIILRGSDEEVSDLFAEPSVQDDVCLFLQERGMDITDLDFSSKQAFLDALGRLCPRLMTVEPINPTMDAGDMDGTPSHQEQKTIRIGGEEFFTVGELKDFLYKERDNGEMIDAIVDSLEDIINFVNEKEPDGTIAISLNKDSGLLSTKETPRERFQLLLKGFSILEANPLIDPTRYIDSVIFRVCISRSKSKGVLLDVSLEYKVKHECSSPLDVALVFNNHTCVWSDRIKIEKHDSEVEKKEWMGIQLRQFPSAASPDDCFHLTANIEAKQYELRIYRRLHRDLFAVMTASPKNPLSYPLQFGLCINSDWFKKDDQLVIDSVSRIGSFNERGITWLQQAYDPHLRWINRGGKILKPFKYEKLSGFVKDGYAVSDIDWIESVIDTQLNTIFERADIISIFDNGYLVDDTLYTWNGRAFMTVNHWKEEVISFSDHRALIRRFNLFSGETKSYYYYKRNEKSSKFVSAQPYVDGKAVVKEIGKNANNQYDYVIRTIDTYFRDSEKPMFTKSLFSEVRYIGRGYYSVRFTHLMDRKLGAIVSDKRIPIPEMEGHYCICHWEDMRDFNPYKHKYFFCDVHDRISEGFIAVKSNDKWGFYNVLEEKIIEFRFDDVGDFENGFAKVSLNYKWGFIDTTGKIVVDCVFDEVQNIYEGVYPAKKEKAWYLYKLKKNEDASILKKNKDDWYSEMIPVPFSYEFIGRFVHGVAPVHDIYWGVISTDGYPLVDTNDTNDTTQDSVDDLILYSITPTFDSYSDWDDDRDIFGRL